MSDIAINVGRDNSAYGGSVRGGAVYLYLKGTNDVFEVRFQVISNLPHSA